MSAEIMHQIVEMIESEAHSRPSPIEFEMAYQARVAIDRIRFAIKHADQFSNSTDQMREASLQLLEALDRLEHPDRRVQARSRTNSGSQSANAKHSTHDRVHGRGRRTSHEPPNGI